MLDGPSQHLHISHISRNMQINQTYRVQIAEILQHQMHDMPFIHFMHEQIQWSKQHYK